MAGRGCHAPPSSVQLISRLFDLELGPKTLGSRTFGTCALTLQGKRVGEDGEA